MSSKYFSERRTYALSALALLALLLTACGGAGVTTATVSNSLPKTTTMTPTGGTSATATLSHQPTGTANLSWDASTHMLTIQLMLTGLAPNSIHPVHIVQGSCSESAVYNKTLYSLANISADNRGVIDVKKQIKVPGGIPASGWYMEIHNGPGVASTAQEASLACANIVNQNTSLKSMQTAQLSFQPSRSSNEDVSGMAHLTLSGHTLTVHMTVDGLAPGSEHVAHIHAGSCASQGAVVYPLDMIKADASGKATVTTTIQDVMTIPAQGWYINLHYGTDLSTQTGFDPIACGDVVLNKA